MGRSAYRRKAESASEDFAGWAAQGGRRGRHGRDPVAACRLTPGGMLDEGERRCGHGSECDQRTTAPSLSATCTSSGPPSGQHIVRRPEALQRDPSCVAWIATGRNVVGDRIVEVVLEFDAQPFRSHTANLRGDRSQISLDLGHWLSTACTLAANCSQSLRRPASALLPRAVRSYARRLRRPRRPTCSARARRPPSGAGPGRWATTGARPATPACGAPSRGRA